MYKICIYGYKYIYRDIHICIAVDIYLHFDIVSLVSPLACVFRPFGRCLSCAVSSLCIHAGRECKTYLVSDVFSGLEVKR